MKKDNTYRTILSGGVKNTRPIAVETVYTLFDAKREPEFYFGGECHTAWEMVYVAEGTVGVTADERVYTLTAGDIIFHRPMEFHKIWSENGSAPRTLIASFDLSGAYAHRLSKSVFRTDEQAKRLIELLLALVHPTGDREDWDDAPAFPKERNYIRRLSEQSPERLQAVFIYLEALLTALALSDRRMLPVQNGEKERIYTAIAALLEERVYGRITLPEIAEECGVSCSTAKKYFAEYAGCGIHKYFLKIKIRTAIELLHAGKTVAEVSELLQFASPGYFGLVFKRETGRTAVSCRSSIEAKE